MLSNHIQEVPGSNLMQPSLRGTMKIRNGIDDELFRMDESR